VEEGTPADLKKRADLQKLFADVGAAHKKMQQLSDKLEVTPVNNKKPRKRLCGKLNRARVETSMAIRAIPFRPNKWKEFAKEIERAVEELSHLDNEARKIDPRSGPLQQAKLRELKREIRKRETAAAATLTVAVPTSVNAGLPPSLTV
jgi:anti-sigma28 factor (negative regulator of flagellin synthesis)